MYKVLPEKSSLVEAQKGMSENRECNLFSNYPETVKSFQFISLVLKCKWKACV